jgi:hypothetical protein
MEETRRLFEQIRNERGLEFSGPLEDVQPVPEGRDEGQDQVIRGIIQKLRVVQNDLGSVRDKLEQVTGKRIA